MLQKARKQLRSHLLRLQDDISGLFTVTHINILFCLAPFTHGKLYSY